MSVEEIRVTLYQAEDGSRHELKKAAEDRNKFIKLEKWFIKSHKIVDNYDCPMYPMNTEIIWLWLNRNNLVDKFLEIIS
ncbi:MAG: hypothetical protein KKD77_22410 [Gammaproteobacteria bacterium]|nr:hypothetical protein [Gammaproteobacteria bacterium]